MYIMAMTFNKLLIRAQRKLKTSHRKWTDPHSDSTQKKKKTLFNSNSMVIPQIPRYTRERVSYILELSPSGSFIFDSFQKTDDHQ